MTPSPTILIVGATGNTGQGVMRHLPELIKNQGFRIVGLTRSTNSPTSKSLAFLPGVEMIEKNYVDIDTAWLRSQNVVRAYVAPQNGPSQFTDESTLHLALLEAGVKYVVKISTNVAFIGPANPVYYGRTHWAIENLLSQPEFAAMQWTSLQPNYFTASFLPTAAEWIKTYRANGNQTDHKLRLTLDKDAPMAMVDPLDVGRIGAHLLALSDADRAPHSGERYIVSGPEDVSGSDVVRAVEKIAGVKVPEESVLYRDTTWFDELTKSGQYPERLLPSLMAGNKANWGGECTLARTPTDEALMGLAKPERTIEDALRSMI